MANPAGELEFGFHPAGFRTPPYGAIFRFRGHVRCGIARNRELDVALGLTAMASETFADARTGRNGRDALAGLLPG